MRPTLKQEKAIYFVEERDIIEFISRNDPMNWDECCDFAREQNITSGEEEIYFWMRNDLADHPEHYNEAQLKWIGGFFEAHPWIERMKVI